MSSNSTSQYANPVLFNFIGYQIQPYWIFIVQLLCLQILQRLYSFIESSCKKQQKHIYIALELTILGPKYSGVPSPKYSILDFILSLISVGHFCYACYLQTKCGSAADADEWRCYNAFGYRLHNYVLPSVVTVLVESIVQLVNTYRAHKAEDKNKSNGNCMKYFKWCLLGVTFVLNTTVALVFIPFFVSNTVPMLIAYCWILLPILFGLTLVYAIIISSVINCIRKCEGCGCVYCLKFFGAHCLVGLQVFGALALSMAYNYSQYRYFGADFMTVMWYEYISRDTVTWYRTLTNSSELIIDNILTAL